MVLEAFSTRATVNARAETDRITIWTGDDSTKEAAGFQFASGLIFEYLLPRYGEATLESWTISTAPARVLSLSDDLAVWYFAGGKNALNPLVQEIYDAAIASLTAIRDRVSGLYGATAGTTGRTVTDTLVENTTPTTLTEQTENPFKDRVYFDE